MMQALKPRFNPKEGYAITDAKFATIYQGKRVINFYLSGQRLKGRLVERRDHML